MDKIFFPDKKELQEAYTQKVPVYEAVLDDLVRSLDRDLKKRGLRFSLKFRVKSFSSYYQKVLEKIGTSKQQDTQPYIWDIIGIRVVCPFLEDVKRAEETIRILIWRALRFKSGHYCRTPGRKLSMSWSTRRTSPPMMSRCGGSWQP